jgi:GPI mannosyltransferase 3
LVPKDTLLRNAIHMVVAGSLLWRLYLAVSGLGVSHPDQIFQYLEQSHRLVFGYGYVPWEYRFGVRNWLLPLGLAVPLQILRDFGLDQPAFYVPFMRGIAAAFSVASLYAVNAIGRNLYGPLVGLIAAALAGFWFELDRFAMALTPEVLGMYAMLGAFALLTGRQNSSRALFVGALLALAAVLRVQYAPVVVAALILFLLQWPRANRRSAILAIFVVCAFVGVLDERFWGVPFVSYFNGINMNLGLGLADTFGTKPLYFYFATLSVTSILLFPAAGLYGIYDWRRHLVILVFLAALLVPHSLIAHKERRFIILATPLMLVLVADGIARLGAIRSGRVSLMWPAALVVAGLSAETTFYLNARYRNPEFDGLLYLSQRDNVRSVLDVSSNDWNFGGYYLLHKDVPFLNRTNATVAMQQHPERYFSHLLVPANESQYAGYNVVASYANICVIELQHMPDHFEPPPPDYRNRLNPDIDGRYTPHVKPWPPL